MSNATTIASESGHWYCAKTGEPRYTVIGKNGKERPTRITDARDKGFVPSVTTITKILAAPGLDKWKQTQVLMASLTLPRLDNEPADKFAQRVIEDAEAQSKAAREAGTKLHGEIEQWLSGKRKPSTVMVEIGYALQDVSVDLHTGKAERSFAHVEGYGGKVDWHNDSTVVDFKTKDRIEDGKRLAYDEHAMQLAAYAHGLGIVAPRCLNVFIGVSDGKVVVHEWNAVEIGKGLRMFKLALELWQEKNDWQGHKTVDQKLDEAGL